MPSYESWMPKVQVDVSSLALGVAGLTLVVALATGLIGGVSDALLVMVTGGLLGAILLVWHSLRTLAGDTVVDASLEVAGGGTSGSLLQERKQRALRALKDIEQEHAVGKIDDTDFAELEADYRARAKVVIREIDATLDPYRSKAEELVKAHLVEARKRPKHEADHGCAACGTANDEDAAFCKKCGEKLAR